MKETFAGSNPLKDAIRKAVAPLQRITEEQAAYRPGAGPGWSRKEELGHLIDSATNNRVRFINATLQGHYEGPGYSADGWVEQGGYAQMHWGDLLQAWADVNGLLAAAIDRIPSASLQSACVIGENPPVTLQFLVEDYVTHLQHHLDHVLQSD